MSGSLDRAAQLRDVARLTGLRPDDCGAAHR